ncbi:MAG: hypothetical protein ABJB76_06330 [Candidatus Nitrosocosmicus sp.]
MLKDIAIVLILILLSGIPVSLAITLNGFKKSLSSGHYHYQDSVLSIYKPTTITKNYILSLTLPNLSIAVQ